MMVTYNPSSVEVDVPFLDISVYPSAASLGDNIKLVGSTGKANMCVGIYYTFNGGALTSTMPGTTCPYTTDSNGEISTEISASQQGTYVFYLETVGVYSNGVQVTVNAPTIELSSPNATLKANSDFYLEATVRDASGNGIRGIAVTFVDQSTGAVPNGNSGNPIITDSNGVSTFSINLGCLSCIIGISCSYTFYAFIVVGENNISISSNKVTLRTSC